MGNMRAVDEMVRKVEDHFDGHPAAEIHVSASDNPFRKLLVECGDILRTGGWVCRRSPSREVAEAALTRLGELGMNVEAANGWGFVYAYRNDGGEDT